MAIDVEGNLYGTAGLMANAPENPAAVFMISPAGELFRRVEVDEDSVTNCNFGGPDLRKLYVTAGKLLLKLRMKNSGFFVYPPVEPVGVAIAAIH